LERPPIDQPRYRSILPSHSAHDLHAVALIESACDHIFPSHTQVQIAASRLYDLAHELLQDFATLAAELAAVQNLVKHDRASGNLHVAHAGAFPVSLVHHNHAVLIDALVRPDAALQPVLSDMWEHVALRLEVPVDRREIAQTGVSHGYRLLKTKIGSLLKALFPMCFSPTILLI